MAGLGEAWLGRETHLKIRFFNQVQFLKVCKGEAGQGMAWFGRAWQGGARKFT